MDKVAEKNTEVTFADGTNDGEAVPKCWIAALVKMNCEKQVSNKLAKLGYDTYVPTQKEIHDWSDRRKRIDRIVIPMVVFVKASFAEECFLRNQSFVYKLLAFPGTEEARKGFATPIPDDQIDRLKFMLDNADSEVTIQKDIEVGDDVRVISGPLRGLEGMVSEIDEKISMVAVRIDGLGYACVSVDRDKLNVV